MTKRDLQKVIVGLGIGWAEAGNICDCVLEAVTAAILAGERLEIRGFGTLEVRDYKARAARKINTGEAFEVPARRSVKFTAHRDLLKQIN